MDRREFLGAGALAAVTFFAGVMSVCIPSPHIAVMALAGGYLVPIVAGRDSGFPLGLDLYLVMLIINLFLISIFITKLVVN